MLGKFKVPGFSYPGGKVRLRKWLVSMMPREGGTYAEPFAGRGNVFWLAALALRFERWWLNDPHTARFLRAISEVDIGAIPLKVSKDAAVKWSKDAQKTNDPFVLVMEPHVAYAGGVKGGGRCTQRHLSGCSYSASSFRQTVRCARRILHERKPRVTANDWTRCGIDRLQANDFAYLDPPYLDSDAGYVLNTVDHERLLQFLKRAKFRWLLSGYDTSIYQRMIGKPFATRSSKIHMRTTKNMSRHSRVECVWRNY